VKTVRVLIADDHAVVRRGLRQILGTTPDLVVAAEAADGRELLEKLCTEPCDVVLMDVTMPDTNAVELIARIRADHPGMPVLVHSMHAESPVASRMLRAGAAGYITKASEPAVLVGALRKLASGGRYISPEIAEQMAFDGRNGGAKPLHELLSEREGQVFRMLAAGRSVNDIAKALHVSPKTASTYKARLMEKLKVETDADLIRYAVTHQLPG
jgi:DNA-binding NarL/FixJ family response regulator